MTKRDEDRSTRDSDRRHPHGVLRLLTLRCEDSTRIISAEADGRVSRLDAWAIRLHLLCCAPCRAFRRQVTAMRDAFTPLREVGLDETERSASMRMPASSRERIESALRERSRG